jgi:hypothetical protein
MGYDAAGHPKVGRKKGPEVVPKAQRINGTLKQLWMPLEASPMVWVPRRKEASTEEVDAPAEEQGQQ